MVARWCKRGHVSPTSTAVFDASGKSDAKCMGAHRGLGRAHRREKKVDSHIQPI